MLPPFLLPVDLRGHNEAKDDALVKSRETHIADTENQVEDGVALA